MSDAVPALDLAARSLSSGLALLNFAATSGLRQPRVAEHHRQAFMLEHLAHQFQIPRLPENGRGGIVAQGVRAHLAGETGSG